MSWSINAFCFVLFRPKIMMCYDNCWAWTFLMFLNLPIWCWKVQSKNKALLGDQKTVRFYVHYKTTGLWAIHKLLLRFTSNYCPCQSYEYYNDRSGLFSHLSESHYHLWEMYGYLNLKGSWSRFHGSLSPVTVVVWDWGNGVQSESFPPSFPHRVKKRKTKKTSGLYPFSLY